MAKLTFIKDTDFRTPISKKNLKQYSIRIPTTNASKIIQEYLFKRNFSWHNDSKDFNDLHQRHKGVKLFLDLNIMKPKQITWSDEFAFAELITFKELKKLYP